MAPLPVHRRLPQYFVDAIAEEQKEPVRPRRSQHHHAPSGSQGDEHEFLLVTRPLPSP